MIFVVVGTQGPFDRLIKYVDNWAEKNEEKIIAQIGENSWKPKHIDWCEKLNVIQFREKIFEADLIVTHGGMGTIITALELGKPVLAMPRLAKLGEHRNDHQVDTVKKLKELGMISVAYNENDLIFGLNGDRQTKESVRKKTYAQLLKSIKNFIEK